jgi:AhpC/TSA family
MSLQEKLDAHKVKAGASRPPEVRAALQRGTDELRASGVLERVLKVGARAPEFALPNQDGAPVSSAALLERGPLVLTFYRGHW